VLAYCSAFKVPVLPFGSVNLTKDLVVAKVSSKSNIVIPFGSFIVLELITALLNERSFFACTDLFAAVLNSCTFFLFLILKLDVFSILLVLKKASGLSLKP